MSTATTTAAWLAHEAANDRADREAEFGPRLWDADPDVCCAAFQLGACAHTEGGYDEYDMSDAELAEFRTAELAEIVRPVDVPDEDEPF